MRRRGPAALWGPLLSLLAATALAGPAAAHVVYGGASLAEMVWAADVVARARIAETSGFVRLEATGERRPVVTAELLEVVKGSGLVFEPEFESEAGGSETPVGVFPPATVRFAQHGHGTAVFEPGEEVVLFLHAAGRSRELGALAVAGDLRWLSLQEHDAKFVLDEWSRGPVGEGVRDYVAVAEIEDMGARLAAWRRLTLQLLRSPEKRLAESALRDLVRSGEELLTPGVLPEIEPMIDDSTIPIGIRLGLLVQLERLNLIEGARRWAQLLGTVERPELEAVVRAAGAHPGPEVTRELVRLLETGGGSVAEAAAIALGSPGNHEAVEPLRRALTKGDAALRMAAIRGLGRVTTAAARAALEEAAESHADEATRRRARAELRARSRER